MRMFFGGINNVNGKLNIILAAMQNFKRFLGMKPLPPGAFVLPSVIPVAPLITFTLIIQHYGGRYDSAVRQETEDNNIGTAHYSLISSAPDLLPYIYLIAKIIERQSRYKKIKF